MTKNSLPVKRRTVIKLMGILGVSGVGLVALDGSARAEPSQDTGSDSIDEVPSFSVAGLVEATEQGKLTLRSAEGPLVDVVPSLMTIMYSGIQGRVDRVAQFVIGDRVIAFGTANSDGSVRVDRIGSVYTSAERVTVRSIGNDGQPNHHRAGNNGRIAAGSPDQVHPRWSAC